MAARKLTADQQAVLQRMVSADYAPRVIQEFFSQRGWPVVTIQAIHYHREQVRDDLERLRAERRESALNTGLALREERVAKLKQHAEELEVLKWEADDKGKLWNEKAWRETLDDIAKELGHRRTGVDLNVSGMSDAELITEAKSLIGGAGSEEARGGERAGPDEVS